MNMQTAIEKIVEARAAWEARPAEVEREATRAMLAADSARSARLRAADRASLAAAGTTPCRDMGDVLAAIDCVLREDAGELEEAASAILSRCADFLRGEIARTPVAKRARRQATGESKCRNK